MNKTYTFEMNEYNYDWKFYSNVYAGPDYIVWYLKEFDSKKFFADIIQIVRDGEKYAVRLHGRGPNGIEYISFNTLEEAQKHFIDVYESEAK